MRKERGLGRVYLRNKIWWIQFSSNGARTRISANTSDRGDAIRLLKKKLHEAEMRKPLGATSTRFDDLAEIQLNDYRANARRSIERAELAIKRLREFFSETKAIDITNDRITAYVANRLGQGVAAGTVNLELAMLGRAFHLAYDAGKVAAIPRIKMLHLNNARKGFLEIEELHAVLRHLPEYLRPAILTGYFTGWRVRSELLSRQWRHVDLEAGWLRLEPGESKNGEGRTYPLTGELLELMQAQRERVSANERVLERVIPWVFPRDDGRVISNYRRDWKRACLAAGVPGKLVHDLRRTSVRNMERASVPRSTAMKLSGHLTESIYKRYAIVDQSMLREGAEKLGKLCTGRCAGAIS